MIIKTGRFGQLNVGDEETIKIPAGVLGFPDYTDFCLIDPGDDTLILWLQSIQNPEVCFPMLEPKVFRSDYTVKLSAAELREIESEDGTQIAVFSVLTIPDVVTEMTANLKAPLVVNLQKKIGRQVVMQENDYSIKHLMFKELRAHLITIQSQSKAAEAEEREAGPIAVKDFPTSDNVRDLAIS